MQTGAQVADQAIQGVLGRIDALAQKLGTTAAHVWDIYVAQAKIEAIRDAAIGGGLLFVAILLGFIGASIEDEDGKAWTFILSVTAVVASLFWFYPAISEGFNPQYWAFQHLTADLKNLF